MQRALSIIALSAVATLSQGEIITINDIVIDGFQPVPPTGSPATGLAMMIIDTDTRNITINGTFDGLLGDVTMAHLHGPANIGVSSPLITFGLQIESESLRSGSFSATERVNSFQLNFILDSRSYINIHSTAHTGGEIRGQAIIPAPGALGLLATSGLVASRRRR
jgi:CHRD domain